MASDEESTPTGRLQLRRPADELLSGGASILLFASPNGETSSAAGETCGLGRGRSLRLASRGAETRSLLPTLCNKRCFLYQLRGGRSRRLTGSISSAAPLLQRSRRLLGPANRGVNQTAAMPIRAIPKSEGCRVPFDVGATSSADAGYRERTRGRR